MEHSERLTRNRGDAMGLSARYYLFPDEGEPLRLAHRIAEGLIEGGDAVPQFANTRMKVLVAILENGEGEPRKMLQADRSVWIFDEEGQIADGLTEAVRHAAHTLEVPAPRRGKVVHLGPEIQRTRLEKTSRWKPTPEQINRVIDDIWPKPGVPPLKGMKATAPHRDPVSHDLRHVLREAGREFWKLDQEIDKLKEPSLKGFIQAARSKAEKDPASGAFYLGLAEIAARRPCSIAR